MTPELEVLARRAVACKGWRWMAGMLACVDVPMPHFGGAVRLRVVADDEAWGGPIGAPIDALPDLADPCTSGGLLALVREAWGTHAYVEWRPAALAPSLFRVMVGAFGTEHHVEFYGPTEAAALVAALEGVMTPLRHFTRPSPAATS